MAKKKKSQKTHREVELLDTLRRLGGSARNSNLAEAMGVSEETIRRTVKALTKNGQLERVHGGVYLPGPPSGDSVFARLGQRSSEKIRIAEAVASLVANGSSVFLDAGSTTAYVAESLQGHERLSVVTNALNAAQALVNGRGARIFLAGGELRSNDRAAFGPEVLGFIGRFNLDTAIISVDAIDTRGGFLLHGLAEAEISRAAIAQARRVVIVADHSKFGRNAPQILCAPEEIDVLVTDWPPDNDMARRLRDWGIETIVTGGAPAPGADGAGRLKGNAA